MTVSFTVVKHPIFLQETLLDEKGQPWFVGKDVAEKLGYKKSRNALMAHVDGEAKKGALNQGSLVVLQIKTIANERGAHFEKSHFHIHIFTFSRFHFFIFSFFPKKSRKTFIYI